MNKILNEYVRFERILLSLFSEWNVFGKITIDDYIEYNPFECGLINWNNE